MQGSKSHGRAGRYRLTEELGRGGMGRVYRAVDESTGKILAFKRLERQEANIVALFEREYHFLASVRHPRIIEVFDFGVDEEGRRFYTMELLDGDSLRALAPIPWKIACRYLRDVATSLSLLHAKRLVHRDVTPLNIKLDRVGTAKLIDFGALATFGVSAEIVGTPAFTAPEIARGSSIDQRTDLFSLGATAYFVLTGRTPFVSRSLADLELGWRTHPKVPSAVVSDIPAALDELVLSMIGLDPLSRPASAAEVIDHLSAIARLDNEPLAGAAQSHLGSSSLIGREREKLQLTRRMEDAEQGLGGVVLIQGEGGMGRSRLSQECVLVARIRGFLTARVEALACPGTFGVASALARQLRQAAPDEWAGLTSRDRTILGELLGELETADASSAAPAAGVSGAELSVDTRSALVEACVTVAEHKGVLIVVDDLQATDVQSAAFLLELSVAARRRRVLIVTTLPTGAEVTPVVAMLRKNAALIDLRPLDPSEVDLLIASMFGEVPHRARLVEWIIRAGGTNPGQGRALLQHLLSRGILRYTQGAWVLPAEFDAEELPADLEQALRMRIEGLDAAARHLLAAFAICRGTVSLALCERLQETSAASEVFATVDSLIVEDFLVSAGANYRLSQEALRPLVLASLTDSQRGALELSIGNALVALHSDLFRDVSAGKLQALPVDRVQFVLETAWHLLRGGQVAQGAFLLNHAAVELATRGEGLRSAVPVLEAALSIYRAQGRSRYETFNILVPLSLAALWVDWRLAYRYGADAMQVALEVTGLDRARRWSAWLGPSLGLYAALLVAVLLYRFTDRGRAARDFKEAFAGLIGIGSALIAAYTILLDVETARKTLAQLAPLAALPERHPGAIVHAYQRCVFNGFTSNFSTARGTGDHLVQLLSSSQSLPGFPEAGRLQLLGGLHAVLGGINSLRVDGAVFANIESIEALRLANYRHNPSSLLARYHLARGETTLYDQQSQRVDTYAAMGEATWREDIILARRLVALHSFTHDVVALKRVGQRIDYLAAECPPLASLREAARASYLAARGELEASLQIFAGLHESIDRVHGVIYSDNASAYADTLNRAGEHARAKTVIYALRERTPAADFEFRFKYFDLDLQNAIADAHLGDLASATAQIDAALREHAGHTNPLLRGRTHQAAARVALVGVDARAFNEHVRAMEEWFRRTESSALMAQHAQLLGLGRQAFRASPLPAARQSAPPADPIDEALGRCKGTGERLEAALDLVLGRSGARRGYLYLQGPGGLRYVAPSAGIEPSETLRNDLSHYVGLLVAEDENDFKTATVHLGASPSDADSLALKEASTVHDPWRVLLEFWNGERRIIVGALVLVDGSRPRDDVGTGFTERLARALYEDHDIQAAYLSRPSSLPATV